MDDPTPHDDLGSLSTEDEANEDGPTDSATNEGTRDDANSHHARSVRRRQSGMLVELLKVILGGIVGIIVAQIILWKLLNQDPFGLAPKLPPSLEFLAPASVSVERNRE
jgi:hypothetical protein